MHPLFVDAAVLVGMLHEDVHDLWRQVLYAPLHHLLKLVRLWPRHRLPMPIAGVSAAQAQMLLVAVQDAHREQFGRDGKAQI